MVEGAILKTSLTVFVGYEFPVQKFEPDM
jgi:hypothetical protein